MKRDLLLLLALALCIGCEKSSEIDDSTPTPESGSVSFTDGGIRFTRVTDSQFDAGDEICVKAFSGGVECDEANYTFSNSKFSSTDPFELSDGESLSYIAVYPSTATFDGVFEVNADQSTAEKYEQSDLLVAAIAESSSTSPELTFSHVLSSIILNVKVEENGVAKSGSTVATTFSLKNQVTVDTTAESYEATGYVTDITPYPSVGNGSSDSYNYSVIVVPQTVAANETIATVVVDGTDKFYFTQSTDLTLQSSKQHTYTLTVDIVTKTISVEFGGAIDSWEDVEPDEPTATMTLAEISETNYPTDADIWVITDSVASTYYDFVGLVSALYSIDSTRMISLRFPNIESLPNNAFEYRENFISVSAPVATSIGSCAFSHCYDLKSIDFPNVAEIGSYALRNTSITSVSIPAENVTIGRSAFSSCTELTTVDIPNVATIDELAFSGCTALTSANLTNVTSISNSAFSSCDALTSIDLPEVTSISGLAFKNCSNLESISIPNVTTMVDGGQFVGCIKLTNVDYNKSYFTISDGIMYDSGMKSLISPLPALCSTSLSLPDVQSVAAYAFYDDDYITSISLPEATEIGESAFYCATALLSVSAPMISSVEASTFSYCSNLSSVDIPNNIPIREYAFENCEKLTSIDISLNPEIGEGAFYYSGLNSITLKNITAIPNYAFQGCSELSSIEIPEVTTIGNYAFQYSKLSSVSLPKVVTVGSSVFADCTELETVDLPEATSVGVYAFRAGTDYPSVLTTVNLPKVTTINSQTFSGCTNLESCTIATESGAKLESVHSWSFYNCTTENITLNLGSANSEYVSGNTLTVGSTSIIFKEIILK